MVKAVKQTVFKRDIHRQVRAWPLTSNAPLELWTGLLLCLQNVSKTGVWGSERNHIICGHILLTCYFRRRVVWPAVCVRFSVIPQNIVKTIVYFLQVLFLLWLSTSLKSLQGSWLGRFWLLWMGESTLQIPPVLKFLILIEFVGASLVDSQGEVKEFFAVGHKSRLKRFKDCEVLQIGICAAKRPPKY